MNVTHPDDEAVDAFARLMKARLAEKRRQGKGGWHGACSITYLSEELRRHVEKGRLIDTVDVANYAMFLRMRGHPIAQPDQPVHRVDCNLNPKIIGWQWEVDIEGHRFSYLTPDLPPVGKLFWNLKPVYDK